MNVNEIADYLDRLEKNLPYNRESLKEAAAMIRQLQAENEALKTNLDFIVGINRLGLGVQKEGGLSSEDIEKIWNSIQEQRDDNFHYGWKKCEQYYGVRK